MNRQAAPCQTCVWYPGGCSSCKVIMKHELAAYLRGEVRIYLSERNRGNKEKRLTDADIIRTANMSCRNAARCLGVSAQTISRHRRDYARRMWPR